nr:retrovirus-related Pol polyprotein from transposon TNT 1-94 [Tanacetum cinerariifolium]
MSYVRTPQQNGVVERRNQTLVDAARTTLIFFRAPLFLWAEAIATACFTQNRSIIHRRFNKTPYELINGRKQDISFLHVFGTLCYPKNDRKDIGKLGAKGDANCEVNVTETFHLQTDDELYDKELKQIEADDQAIQTILLDLPEDIYASVDSCETAQEIWLRVQQMMKGSDIGIQEKKAKLFNEWERFTSNEGESIESYYNHFLKLMNDLKRNKHFPEKIARNLKFLNNLQPEWSRHIQDPLALMANSNNPYVFPAPHQDQPSFNQNYLQQPMPNPEDITDLTTVMNMDLALMAKAFKLNYSTPTNNNQRLSSNPRNMQIAQPGQNVGNSAGYNDVIGNQNQIGNGNLVAARAKGNAAGQNENQIRCYNYRGVGRYARNCTVRPRRRDAAYLQTQLLIAQKEDAGIQLQAEEYDLMATAADLDEIEEVNANCILMANLQQASTSGTQTDSAPIYDTDGSAEEAAKFVGDFKSLANEADASLAKHKALELEIEHLLKTVVSQDIMIIVQNESVVDTLDLKIELERMKERFENCIIKKETEYAKLWNDWYKKCDECKYDKISYDKAYKDMQQKIERLQDQLGDLKGKSKDTSSVSDTQNLLSQKLKNENVSDQKDNTQDTGKNAKFAKQPIVENLSKIGKTNALSKLVSSKSVSTPQEPKSVNNDKVIAPGMFKINPSKTSREEKHPKVTKPKKVEHHKSLATPKPRKPRFLLRWSPTGRLFDQEGKLAAFSNSESQYDCSNGDNACSSNNMEPKIKRTPNSTSLLDSVRFGNDHVADILGFGDLQWGNILITRVYFVEGLGYNLFSVGQFYDSDLEAAFRRNACFIRNLEGVDLLKGDRSKNLYTINLHEMASASPICLMARASSTKSWLWHQR